MFESKVQTRLSQTCIAKRRVLCHCTGGLPVPVRGCSEEFKTCCRCDCPLESLFMVSCCMGFEIALRRKSQASLREYFLNGYKVGGAFEHGAYEYNADEWCWIHKRSGIKVWQDAVDLTQSGGTGEVECLFHYTTQLGFRNITSPSKKAVEVFASLVTGGPKANAWWGQGVYSVRRAPDEWPDVATLIDNNFRNMHKRDVGSKGREAADQEYASRVAYCIPILANAAMCYDVSVQQTPEMQTEAWQASRHVRGPVPVCSCKNYIHRATWTVSSTLPRNLAGKLLNEPGQPERQCIVIRVESEEQVGHASAELLDTLQCRAVAAAEKLGPEHDTALLALNRLGIVLEERGAFAKAVPLQRRVLAVEERRRGRMHRRTITAVGNLALVLHRLGELHEAEDLYRRCLAACKVNLGEQHPETLNSMNNLAGLLEEQGKLDEAEELQCKALEGREAQLGAHHPETLQSINNLAVLLQTQGKLYKAEALKWKALARRETRLGVHHPETLQSINNLAVLLGEKGKVDEAERLHRAAMEGGESQLGPQHPDTLRYVNNLACLLEKQGKLDEAEELCRSQRFLRRGGAALSPRLAWHGGAAWCGARRDASEPQQPGAIPRRARFSPVKADRHFSARVRVTSKADTTIVIGCCGVALDLITVSSPGGWHGHMASSGGCGVGLDPNSC
eukprot:s2438_g11.t2